MTELQNQKIAEYIEKIDFTKDPNMFLFYRHILTGLMAFANPQQTAEESIAKYKMMLRIAESFIGSKFGVDFVEIRSSIREREKDESMQLMLEIQEISKLLDQKIRKVDLHVVFKKGASDSEFEEEVALLEEFASNNESSDTSDDL